MIDFVEWQQKWDQMRLNPQHELELLQEGELSILLSVCPEHGSRMSCS